jgi:hypothetical protein
MREMREGVVPSVSMVIDTANVVEPAAFAAVTV